MITTDNTWTTYTFECQFKIEQTFARPVGCGKSSSIGIGVYADDGGGDNGIYSYVSNRGGGWNSFPGFIVSQGNQTNKQSVGKLIL